MTAFQDSPAVYLKLVDVSYGSLGARQCQIQLRQIFEALSPYIKVNVVYLNLFSLTHPVSIHNWAQKPA